ncbi:hypothetical protein TWF694_009442 [Orbilia ellipsospora]|uniref:Uncharacterized protein n=1 Tax=Orbilia ellipsospora TaxID=2528407 RepID=A0AAV9XAS9_9PEZI
MKSFVQPLAVVGILALGVSAQSATSCTPYPLLTGCPTVYDPCCKFNCIAAGGMGSTCLDHDDTRDQVICSQCPFAPAAATQTSSISASASASISAAVSKVSGSTTTNSRSTGTCTPYQLMTGCPQVYDPCCAFNCIAAGGMGSTCLDYDDTRDQVICSACATAIPRSTSSFATTRTSITLITPVAALYKNTTTTTQQSTISSIYLPSTTPATSSSLSIASSLGPHTGPAVMSGNISSLKPRPTGEPNGAANVKIGGATIFGLFFMIFAL